MCSSAVAWCETALIVAIPIAMIALAAMQIVLRNVFESSAAWADPMVRVAVLWVGLLGAMIATRKADHIAIDIVSHYCSEKVRVVVNVFVSLFSFAVCALVAYHCFRFVIEERTYESTIYGDIPSWPFQVIMPIAFSVMALRFFILAVLVIITRKPVKGKY